MAGDLFVYLSSYDGQCEVLSLSSSRFTLDLIHEAIAITTIAVLAEFLKIQ